MNMSIILHIILLPMQLLLQISILFLSITQVHLQQNFYNLVLHSQ